MGFDGGCGCFGGEWFIWIFVIIIIILLFSCGCGFDPK